jgi:RNA polymerase sigma-70 factor (ECF subfamily)
MRGTDWRMFPVAANGQPGVAAYVRSADRYRLHTLQIFAVAGQRVAHTVVFQDPLVFALFDLAPAR